MQFFILLQHFGYSVSVGVSKHFGMLGNVLSGWNILKCFCGFVNLVLQVGVQAYC